LSSAAFKSGELLETPAKAIPATASFVRTGCEGSKKGDRWDNQQPSVLINENEGSTTRP